MRWLEAANDISVRARGENDAYIEIMMLKGSHVETCPDWNTMNM